MIGITWTGQDGSVWDLRTGRVRLMGEVEGLGYLGFDRFTQDTAARDGQRFQGWRAGPRSVLLPVLVGPGRDETDYINLERAWWKSLHPNYPGKLSITTHDGMTRELILRLVDDGKPAFKEDPTKRKLIGYPLNLIADDPYFYGKTGFGRTFGNIESPVSFLGGGKVGATYAWSGTPGNSTSTETLNQLVRTNYALSPAARGGGWVSPSGTLAYRTGSGIPGIGPSSYARIAPTSAADSKLGSGASVVDGSVVTLSGYVRTSYPTDVTMTVQFTNASGNAVGAPLTAVQTVAAGEWNRMSILNVVAPATTTGALLTFSAVPLAAGNTIDATGLLVEQGSAVGDYFDGSSAKGTPLVLGKSYSTDAATLANPGDVEAWPIYTLTGPLNSWSITVGTGVLAGGTLAKGDTLTIDTSPVAQTAILRKPDGSTSNVIRTLSSWGFRRIPAGDSVKLTIKLSGAGTVQVSGQPRYFKAW